MVTKLKYNQDKQRCVLGGGGEISWFNFEDRWAK